MSERGRCEDCAHADIEDLSPQEPWISCHRRSPAAGTFELGELAHWPRVKPDDWCSEYLDRPAAPT